MKIITVPAEAAEAIIIQAAVKVVLALQPEWAGFVGIARKSVYAGLGGEAGKVTQVPYAEMPQKTLLFPGKGGKGRTGCR